MVINNLIRETKHLQEEIKDMKQFRHCERIYKLYQCWHELKGRHDQFGLLKIICIVVFFEGIFFFAIVVVKEVKS